MYQVLVERLAVYFSFSWEVRLLHLTATRPKKSERFGLLPAPCLDRVRGLLAFDGRDILRFTSQVAARRQHCSGGNSATVSRNCSGDFCGRSSCTGREVMALTLEAEQRLEDVGLVGFFEQNEDAWKDSGAAHEKFLCQQFSRWCKDLKGRCGKGFSSRSRSA